MGDRDLFASPTGAWQPVSPLLARSRIIVALGVAAVAVVISVVMLFLLWEVGLALLTVTVLAVAWVFWWAPRNSRTWGWAEGPTTFAVKSGLMFRDMTVIPYGRIQLVEVESGPVATHVGIAHLQIRTASEHGATVVRGLPADVATALRDRLLDTSDPWSSGV